ncbi:hypothetical protein JCM10212_004954 [Sporobolomyces blumeae]
MASHPAEKPFPPRVDTNVGDKADDAEPSPTTADADADADERDRHKAPADSAKFSSPNDCNHPPDLSGWGMGGERYGGMGQAKLRDTSPDARDGRELPPRSSTGSTGSSSSSEEDGDSSSSQRDEPALSKEERHRLEDETRERELFEQGGSRSYHGGMNQGFMSGGSATIPRDFQPMPSAQDKDAQRLGDAEDEAAQADSSDVEPTRKPTHSPRSALSALPPNAVASAPRLGRQRTATLPEEDLSKSSILAIHRPIAARRRTESGEPGEAQGTDGMYVSQTSEGSIVEEGQGVAEETLDEATKRPLPPSRTQTGGTEKSMSRRLALAEKLMDVFGLEEVEDVVAEFPCWLFRSVLLQGYLYLTTGHVCFYAYLSQREGTTVRSGSLSVRSKARRYHKHWFILKDSILSWYPSSTDPYFPDGHVDLHYCIAVEPSSHNRHHFKVTTNEKRWHFSADSEASRDEWVKTIKKVVFRCQNEGESVKIAIPLETIIDIERSHSLEFAETIRLRVYDADEGYTIDEYWLSYFKDMEVALEKLHLVLDTFRKLHQDGERVAEDDQVGDSTKRANADINDPTDQVRNTKSERKDPDNKRRSLTDKVSSMFGTDEPKTRSQSPKRNPPVQKTPTQGSTLASKLKLFSSTNASPDTPVSGSVATIRPVQDDDATLASGRNSSEHSASMPPPIGDGAREDVSRTSTEHTYPPASAPGQVGPPSHRTSTLGRIFSASSSSVSSGGRKILEVVTHSNIPGRAGARSKTAAEKRPDPKKAVLDETLVEEPEDIKEEEGPGKGVLEFRKMFGLSDKEDLLEQYPAYLYRGLPISGRVYVSTNTFCFRSSGLLAVKTKMLLPTADILSVSRHRSYRIGFSGLMLVIRGHEEVFLEFSSAERRDECLEKLEARLEEVRSKRKEGKDHEDSVEHKELTALLDLSGAHVSNPALDYPHPRSEAISGQPPVMFSSTTSDFVTFRPEKALRFTCLTIGSRGDVQPYIALCKGLMAQGHKCKIASHGEYKSWVEGHGIEFAAVGGDPAELMQLMISHDFFTISFMKEAIGKFRGWLDDLLDSAWEGCQNTDVLIESPSAIAGYHIAEALQIPYYRAFTMPWSRTRAYPHAFAVPEIKMGGGYNYMTYTMFDQVFWRATSGQVNRWRKDSLKIRATSLDAMQQHKIPFLYNFSPVVIPPPLDWRENIHVTGYWILENSDDSDKKKWEPPQDLLDWIEEAKSKEKKVVFIGFGSIIIPDPVGMSRVISEAVEKADVYAIVAKGWSDRAGNKDESEEAKRKAEEKEKEQHELLDRPFIFNVKSIPHDWLFPRISAAMHHGGAGTTGASLRAGLPTIIRPFFGDQHFYADRVQTLGIGTHIHNFNTKEVTEALVSATTDEKQIERARQAGEDIRKEDGVANAIECIYRDLEYARSLVPKPTDPDKEDLGPSSDTDDEDAGDIAQSVADNLDEADRMSAREKRRDGEGVDDDDSDARSARRHELGDKKKTRSSGDEKADEKKDGNRTAGSSDEGWEVMSRGSATESAVSVSRGSSAAASPRSASHPRHDTGDASKAMIDPTTGQPEKSYEGKDGQGLTAKMLNMLGKPLAAVSSTDKH